MLQEMCSCFTFTGTQGLVATSSQLSEALAALDLNPSETMRGIISDRLQCKASKYSNYRSSNGFKRFQLLSLIGIDCVVIKREKQ